MASINLQGDTSGSISISAPSVAGTNTLTLPATTQTLATQNALGVRNLIINGDMKIAQRGTSINVSINGNGTEYVIDRFALHTRIDNWNVTASQDTDVPIGYGFYNSLKIDVNATTTPTGSGNLVLIQRIEPLNVQHLEYGTSNAKTTTVTFWVKSNKTGTYNFQVQNAGTGGNYVLYTYTIDTADTWEKKTITFNGDTDKVTTSSLGLVWHLAVGPDDYATTTSNWVTNNGVWVATSDQVNLADSTSNYINITGVQLEVGEEATEFEHRPYDMELQRCQRYFRTVGDGMIGRASSATVVYYSHCFENPMRATPTMSVASGATVRFGNLYSVDHVGSSHSIILSRATNISVAGQINGFSGMTTADMLQSWQTNITGWLHCDAEL